MSLAWDEVVEDGPEYARMLDILAQIRQQYYGNSAELDRRLGHSEGYLGRVLRQEIRLTADMLLRVLRALDVEPGVFFQQIFAASLNVTAGFDLLQRRLASLRLPTGDKELKLDAATETVLQRLAARLGRRQSETLPATESSSSSSSALDAENDPRQVVESLRRLIFESPEDASQRLGQWLEQVAAASVSSTSSSTSSPPSLVDDDTLARGLESQALALQSSARPAAACRHLRLAWGLCSSPSTRAEVLCTSAALARRSHAPEMARLLCIQATEAGLLRHDLSTVGRTLVQQAEILLYGASWEASAQTFEAALNYLPEADWQDRFEAHLGAARCRLQGGKTKLAATHLRHAETLHRSRQGVAWWRLMKLQGKLAERQQKWSTAATLYHHLRLAYQDLAYPVETLLAHLREARVLLALDQRQDVMQVAAGTMSLLRPLKRQPVMGQVITDMTRLALVGDLTVEWLQGAEARVRPLADFHCPLAAEF